MVGYLPYHFILACKCLLFYLYVKNYISLLPVAVSAITQGPIDTPGVLDGSVMFTCTATGIPLPTITWMDENIILMGSDMIINDTTIQSTLTLSNLQDDDFDNYTCTATNIFGSHKVAALLGSECTCKVYAVQVVTNTNYTICLLNFGNIKLIHTILSFF